MHETFGCVKMYAQTLSVALPQLQTSKPRYLIGRPQSKEVPKTHPDLPTVYDLANYKVVANKINHLSETLKLPLPEDVHEAVIYVMEEFRAYTKFMQVTMGEWEKQDKFTKHMLHQIEKATLVIEFFSKQADAPVRKYLPESILQ